jgi:hypothetical protein
MAIPSQQIGWSQKAKLLWQISKQLETLIKVTGNTTTPTTSTTTTTTSNVFSENAAMGFVSVDVCASSVYMPLYYSGSLGNGTALFYDAALTQPYTPGLSGTYVKLYFQAQDQVCTMSGNTIQSYTAC